MSLSFLTPAKPYVLIQDAISRDYPVSNHVDPERLKSFSAPLGMAQLQHRLIEIDAGLNGKKIITFCSLPAARIIQRSCPNLSRGLFVDFEFMKFHRYSAYIPDGMLLNEEFIMMPFKQVERSKAVLERCFGKQVFMRPDSSGKCFSGVSLHLEDLEQEMFALRQIHSVDPEELVVIAPHKDLPEEEFRFWLIDGVAYSPAGYMFDQPHKKAGPCPANIQEAAHTLANHLETINNAVVADFVATPDGPKLVELNGISTSGFYPDMNLSQIIDALKTLMMD
jgi:hypothetical protein